MTYFLAKTDPEAYSMEDLERDQTTIWDGVRNAQAVRVIQSMRPGDDILLYHSMSEAAIVGRARVTSEPRPDPQERKSWV
ncbi:MAG: EVE domain-containing protein, partial [Ktedonobacteraceae bacterium]